jgi:hypothetical protein
MTEIKPTATEQLQGLAAISNITGGLHEAQVTQLRLYGLACSSAVRVCEISWDPQKREILYFLDVDQELLEEDLDKRITFLKHATAAIMRGWNAKVRLRRYGTMTPDVAEVLYGESTHD